MCCRRLTPWFLSKWSNLPPDPALLPQQQVLYAVYDQWFAPSHARPWKARPVLTPLLYIFNILRHQRQRTCCLMLRFTNWVLTDLPVATAQVDCPTLAPGRGYLRQTRYSCEECSSSSIGDEFHMIFECQFYNSVRSQFAPLFTEFGGLDNLQRPGTTNWPAIWLNS